eukprot:m.801196 g.801196  ORF g.801196 m.801196 type:complete len:59 (-) comp23357_c1_seq3:1124-1300(-)
MIHVPGVVQLGVHGTVLPCALFTLAHVCFQHRNGQRKNPHVCDACLPVLFNAPSVLSF